MPSEEATNSRNETDPIEVVRTVFDAYIRSDRAAIEQVIAADFHFSSPRDNRIDRQTYFARCWPNNERIVDFKLIYTVNDYTVNDGDRVFVTYEGQNKAGHVFRNTEILTVRHGKLVEAEVYFGWSIPHEAPLGGFTDTIQAASSLPNAG
jgi:ketosteroid isomerase-like protein